MNKALKIFAFVLIALAVVIGCAVVYFSYQNSVVESEEEVIEIQEIPEIVNEVDEISEEEVIEEEKVEEKKDCEFEKLIDETEGVITISWQDRVEVSRNEIFKEEAIEKYNNCRQYVDFANSRVYKTGTIIDGPFKGSDLLLAFLDVMSMGTSTEIFRLIKNDEDVVLLTLGRNGYDATAILKSNDNIEISNLGLPDIIEIGGTDTVFRKEKYYPGIEWSDKYNFEKIYEFGEGNYLYKSASNCFYVKTSDGVEMQYYISKKEASERDQSVGTFISEIKWADGETEEESYSYREITGGCGGGGCYNYDYDVSGNEMIAVGNANNSDVIYERKEYDDGLITELEETYERIWPGYKTEKIDYDEYLADHPIVYWQDPFGDFIKLKKTKYLPAVECGKPVIYLYPEQEQDISVWVEPNGGFTVTEPVYDNGWRVRADKESNIYNYADGEVYPYLFWEGHAYNYRMGEKGFVVAREDVREFLVDSLAKLGLIQKEYDEFIEFWLPKMQEKNYYFISFMPQAEFEQLAPLTVLPKPDTVIRVFMDYQGLDNAISVEPQELSAPARNGFTVVEWGGALHR